MTDAKKAANANAGVGAKKGAKPPNDTKKKTDPKNESPEVKE